MATLISATKIRNAIIDALSGRTNSASLSVFNGYGYLGLSTTVPDYDASGDITGITEPAAAQGYERKLIGHSTETSTLLMSAAAKGAATNSEEIHFNQAKESTDGGTGWGNVKYFAIYTTKTGGTPILAGSLTTAVDVSAGYVFVIKTGELKITMNSTAVSG